MDEIVEVIYCCWMDLYWLVERWEQARGVINLGNKWDFRYMPICAWFNLLLVKIRVPRCVDVKRVWSCLVWSPEGGLSTPRYLKEEVMESCLIVTMEEVAEDLIRMVWLLLSFIIGKPVGEKSQLMQYQAHFDSSNYPPVMWGDVPNLGLLLEGE